MPGANSTEFNLETPFPVVALVTTFLTESGIRETRSAASDLGGTMRLGAQKCQLAAGSLSEKIYGKNIIQERHRHRYEVNNQWLPLIEKAGLRISGRTLDGHLVEMIEIPEHPWFVACQFHPEFHSTPRDGHPLFTHFIRAAIQHSRGANES